MRKGTSQALSPLEYSHSLVDADEAVDDGVVATEEEDSVDVEDIAEDDTDGAVDTIEGVVAEGEDSAEVDTIKDESEEDCTRDDSDEDIAIDDSEDCRALEEGAVDLGAEEVALPGLDEFDDASDRVVADTHVCYISVATGSVAESKANAKHKSMGEKYDSERE